MENLLIIIVISLLYAIGFAVSYYMMAMYITKKLKINWNKSVESLTNILALGSWITFGAILIVKIIDCIFDEYHDKH